MREIVARGAEAVLYIDNGKIIKERIDKRYRINEIDELLRKNRTKTEVKLLSDARRNGVKTPKILDVDEKKMIIIMEFVSGDTIKECLKNDKKCDEICEKIGISIAKLHTANIIHGDLTTSNMIFSNEDVYFIDFGLGFFSNKFEDKAVDLHLLNRALRSTHFNILNRCWDIIMKEYKDNYVYYDNVFKKLIEIKSRGRYLSRGEK